jgi:type VI secretion system protein ImpM
MGHQVGAFGKIPALGDFFRLNVPNGFVTPWDAWVQGALLAGKGTLGPRWDATYMVAPIWQFALEPGLCGTDAVIGVLMPSVDRVGRQYPLTLAATVSGGPPALWSLLANGAVLEALETLALDCLDDAMTRETLTARLEAIAPPQPRLGSRLRASGGGIVMRTARGETLAADLAHEFSKGRFPQEATFCAILETETRLMTCAGLPGERQSVALFDTAAAFWAEGQ